MSGPAAASPAHATRYAPPMTPWNPSREQLQHLAGLRAVAQRLAAIGYSDDLGRRLGAIGGPGWIDSARATLATGGFTPELAAAVRLLLLGEPLAAGEAEAALGGPALAALSAAGVIITSDQTVQAAAMLTPFNGLLVFSDRSPDRDLSGLPPDYVLPVNNASQLLADLTIRVPGGLAVEMGCGQGYLAALAAGPAGDAARVVGTDINPRALAMARATAAINGRESIEIRPGNLLEPLADLRGQVDTFFSNPPFVFGTVDAPVAISGGSGQGDGLFEHLVREVPGLLKHGGWATLVGAWLATDAADWSARPRAWLNTGAGDAIIFRFEQLSPDAYYRQWLAGGAGDPTAAVWERLCSERKIEAVCIGAIVFRRRGGNTWCRTQLANVRGRNGSASAQLRALFAATTRLRDLTSIGNLLDWKLRFVADRRVILPDAGSTGVPHLIHTRGLALPVPLDPRAEQSLARFDGTRPARAVLDELASVGMVSGAPESPEALQTLSTLILTGFLVPEGI